MKIIRIALPVAAIAVVIMSAAHAQTGSEAEMPFILNSLFLLICGALVMFMAAGFTMLEAGSVRSRSVVTILIKNIALYSIAGIMFYLVGHTLMFGETASDMASDMASDTAAHAGNAFWFFQMVFVATAASVVSGALAERMKLWPFLLFVVVLCAIIYPVVGSWTWGGGWLSGIGFADFAGSTIVHSVGGWAALAGAFVLGPRAGRFGHDGPKPMPYASAPQIAMGVLILWFGWFGFNGGSQLSFSSMEDAIAVAGIFVNTNAAAAGGVLTALVLSTVLKGKPDFVMTLNGALAGLVAITAEPSAPTVGLSVLIGAGGSVVMIAGLKLLEYCEVDDVVGAIPVHLFAGVYGTVIAAFTSPAGSVLAQLTGITAIGFFVFTASIALWAILRVAMGLRLNKDAETAGADLSETGSHAYSFDTNRSLEDLLTGATR